MRACSDRGSPPPAPRNEPSESRKRDAEPSFLLTDSGYAPRLLSCCRVHSVRFREFDLDPDLFTKSTLVAMYRLKQPRKSKLSGSGGGRRGASSVNRGKLISLLRNF